MQTGLNGAVTLLLYLVIFGLILYLINWIVGMFTLPQQVKYAILVIVSIIALVLLLNATGITHIAL